MVKCHKACGENKIKWKIQNMQNLFKTNEITCLRLKSDLIYGLV